MGLYSITHLPGNIIAGYGVDRLGSRIFIVISLGAAGVILVFQASVTDPWQLLILRSISGFVLAFLSPACMTLLARMSQDRVKQGKLMAGNGLIHTLASVVSPAAGAYLVAQIGFTTAFLFLGWLLIITACCALFFIRDIPLSKADQEALRASKAVTKAASSPSVPWIVYLLPIATSCAQGILSFELPLLATSHDTLLTTGLLFSVVSIGALLTLSMLFLNRMSAYLRTLWGSLLLALAYFGIAAGGPLPLYLLLLILGMAKGIIFPALTTFLIELSGGQRYGRTFSILSIAFSVGAFIGPMAAGHIRDFISPYFLAFLFLMAAVAILPFYSLRPPKTNAHFS